MLTVAEFAKAISVSERTARRILAAGDVAYNRFRGAIRIPLEAVADYKRRTLWPSRSSPMGGISSSSNPADVVFSDGSRPARRKPRPKSSTSSANVN